ncbi:hypothetical protein AMTRI_Chr03g50040 [Amborella trichopoda]
MINKISGTEIRALAKHICMSPHKARGVIDQIRGCSYEQTLMILELKPYRVSYPVFKLVYSAATNASHNMAEVHGGAMMKKFKPKARGRSYPIKRPTCHITIVLKERKKSPLVV